MIRQCRSQFKQRTRILYAQKSCCNRNCFAKHEAVLTVSGLRKFAWHQAWESKVSSVTVQKIIGKPANHKLWCLSRKLVIDQPTHQPNVAPVSGLSSGTTVGHAGTNRWHSSNFLLFHTSQAHGKWTNASYKNENEENAVLSTSITTHRQWALHVGSVARPALWHLFKLEHPLKTSKDHWGCWNLKAQHRAAARVRVEWTWLANAVTVWVPIKTGASAEPRSRERVGCGRRGAPSKAS